jgi:hypothetical protein
MGRKTRDDKPKEQPTGEQREPAPEQPEAVVAAPADTKSTDEAIQEGLRDAVSAYMTEHFPKDQQEVTVDPTFLKEHGPGLFAALLSGFAQAIVPEEIKVDVPTEDGSKKPMTLKVDFGSLFKNLGKPADQVEVSNDPPKEPDQG